MSNRTSRLSHDIKIDVTVADEEINLPPLAPKMLAQKISPLRVPTATVRLNTRSNDTITKVRGL